MLLGVATVVEVVGVLLPPTVIGVNITELSVWKGVARNSHDGLAENSSHVNQEQIKHFSNTTAAFSSKTISVLSVLIALYCTCV